MRRENCPQVPPYPPPMTLIQCTCSLAVNKQTYEVEMVGKDKWDLARRGFTDGYWLPQVVIEFETKDAEPFQNPEDQ